MVIRAKDQASRVVNSVANAAIGDFARVQREAVTRSRQLGINMADMRLKYDRAILQSRERLFAAERAGDTVEAAAARERIKRLQLIRDAQALNIRQQQVAHRQQQLEIRQQMAARQAALEHYRAQARIGGVMIATGAAAVLVGAAGVKALHSMAMGAVEYQRQAALTLTQTDKIKTSTQELQKISNNVASAIGVPLEALQPALYDIFSSMNVNLAQSQRLLTAFSKEAVAGQVSIQDASRATIGIMNAFHVPVEKVNDVLDFQFQLVRKGVGTFGQFATTIGRSVPSAVRAGQSYQTLGAMLAFLTRNGLSAAMASASAGRALDAFANPRVVARFRELGDVIAKKSGLSSEALQKLGIDTKNTGVEIVDAQGKFRNIVPVMGELSAVLMKLPPASRAAILQELFKGAGGTIQAMRFFNVAIPRYRELAGLLRDMGDDAGQFEKAYGQMAETTAAQTVRLSNNWKILKNALGAEVMPALNDMIERGNKLLINLHQMEPSQRRAIANTLLYGSVSLAAVGMVVALSGAIVIMNAGFKTAALWIGTARTSLASYTVTAGGATAATVGLATKLGLLAVAIGLATEADKINQESQKLGHQLHVKYVRPMYEKLGLLNSGLAKQSEGASRSLKAQATAWRGVTVQAAPATTTVQQVGRAMSAAEKSANFLAERGLARVVAQTGRVKIVTPQARVATEAYNKAFKAQIKAVQDVIPYLEGYENKIKTNAATLNKYQRQEIQGYMNWAKNTQILLKRGADPRWIESLSKKGPQFVAAYAAASNRELKAGEKNWRERHAAYGAIARALLQREGAKNAAEAGRQGGKAGKAYAQGLEGGIRAFSKEAIAAASGIARMVIAKTKAELGIKSPSVVAYRIGAQWAEGFYRGLSHNEQFVKKYVARMRNVLSAGVADPRHAGLIARRGGLSAAEAWIIARESGGSVFADNPTSTAFGLGQLLLANRQYYGRLLGFSPSTTSYSEQLAMFRAYVRDRYGTAENAKAFWQAHGWYGEGGIFNKPSIIGVGERGPEAVVPLRKFSTIFRENLQSWIVPWLRRIAVGVERIDHASRTISGGSGGGISAMRKSPLLTAQQLVKLSDAARWAYVKKHGLPKVPPGFVWAEDFTYVPLSFYSKTSYDRGGRINEDILGIGRSGRTYGFQRGETVVARGGDTYDNKKNVQVTQHIYTQEIAPQQNAQLLGWELARRL